MGVRILTMRPSSIICSHSKIVMEKKNRSAEWDESTSLICLYKQMISIFDACKFLGIRYQMPLYRRTNYLWIMNYELWSQSRRKKKNNINNNNNHTGKTNKQANKEINELASLQAIQIKIKIKIKAIIWLHSDLVIANRNFLFHCLCYNSHTKQFVIDCKYFISWLFTTFRNYENASKNRQTDKQVKSVII